MPLTMTIYVDGAASSTVVALTLSRANECTVRFPLGSTALDARCSSIRCVISDAETEEILADVTATMGLLDDEWVRMPGSRPVTSCTVEADEFTVAVDVRDDAFLPAVLTAVRVLRHAARCVQEEEAAAATVTVTDRVDDDEADDDEADWRPAAVAAPFAHWLRESPLRVPAARVWHGALPSAACRAALRSDALLLAELYQHRPGTFWLPLHGAEPRCGLERFALEVLRFHLLDGGPAVTPPPPEAEVGAICGAEWWVQVRRVGASDGSTIAFHWDSDETCMRAGVHVPPLLATVTYLGGVGAPTVVLPLTASERGVALIAAAGADDEGAGAATACAQGAAYLSRPVPGKHLAFDGRLLHGCPAEYSLPPAAAAAPATSADREPSAAEEDTGSLRLSLLVNVWRCHRPLAAHRLPAELATRLSSDPDGADGSNLFVLRGTAAPVAPAEWHGVVSVALSAPPVTLRIGSGGKHPPVVVRGLPPAAAVRGIAADFVRVPMVVVCLQ